MWDDNPDAILFKKEPGEKSIRYSPEDITSFTITGLASYEKYSGPVSTDEVDVNRLNSKDTSFKMASVFLRVLQKGKNATLYSYTDNLKSRYFVADNAGAPKELIYRVYKGDNGNTIIDGTYLTQLNVLAIKYNALNDDLGRILEGAEYKEPSLMFIVSKINNIKKDELDKMYPDHSKFGLYISAAVNISSTSSSAATAYSAAGGKSYTSYLPAVGFGVNFIPNAISDNVELRVDVSAATAKFMSAYKFKVSPYVAAQTSFNQLNVSVSPQLIYNFYHGSKLDIYAGAGLVLTYFNFTNSYFGTQDHTNVPGFPKEPFLFSKSDAAFLLKAGVRIHKNMEIYFNYITSESTSESPYFAFYNTNMQAGVSYFFGR
ncbi:MAG: hypothetical protein ACXVJD_09400 [Mucilaginibacter sp.]